MWFLTSSHQIYVIVSWMLVAMQLSVIAQMFYCRCAGSWGHCPLGAAKKLVEKERLHWARIKTGILEIEDLNTNITLNVKLSVLKYQSVGLFWRRSSKAFIHPRTFILLSQGLCLLCLEFIKVILMVNIKKVNIIVFVFHFPARWPFNSLDRLLCSWQQHGNFFRPLTYMMWGSTLQLSIPAFTRRSRPLTLSGWHSEADGRASQDCLQMFFWGPPQLI